MNATNQTQRRRRQQQRRQQQRRGIAMLLVLGLVAIASVLSWAMLSTATVRAQVETTIGQSLDAAYQADSGVSYALYYVRYPEKSPVAIQYNANGGYTTTQTGLRMWNNASGTTDVTITTPGDGNFSIRSSAVVDGIKRTSCADATYTYDRYAPTHAAAFNGSFTVPAKMTFTGPVVSKGTVIDPLLRVSTTPTGVNVTPAIDELTLLSETADTAPTSGTDRPYTYDGVAYWAEQAPATITGTLVSAHPVTNPKNVWFARANTTINNATINGTLIVRDLRTLTVTGTNTITAYAEMPALICTGTLDMKSTTVPAKLTVNGCAWLGSTVTDSATVRYSNGWLKVNGALLFGGAAPSVNSRFGSPLDVVYDPAVSKIPALSTVKTVNGLSVRGWKSESN